MKILDKRYSNCTDGFILDVETESGKVESVKVFYNKTHVGFVAEAYSGDINKLNSNEISFINISLKKDERVKEQINALNRRHNLGA